VRNPVALDDGPRYDADDPMSLMEYAERIHKNADAHGFWPSDETPDALINLIDNRAPGLSPQMLDKMRAFVNAHRGRNFGEMIALMHSELSEALEEHRSGKPAFYLERQPYGPDKPEGTLVEIIDVIIRALDTAYSIAVEDGLDLDRVCQAKMEFNESRPHKHGRRY
jgi:hypothetical protein